MTIIKVKSRGTDNVAGGGRRNLLINGGMQVAQRGLARTSSDNSWEGFVTVDRWSFRWNNSVSGVATISQESGAGAPTGFGNYFKVNVGTANNSMGSSTTDWVYMYQPIEAQNLQKLKYGTSSAEKLTLSFYAKRVGTWGQSQNISVGLQTADGTPEYINASVTTQTTWTRHVVTFNGSTSATINNDNGLGMNVFISLAGSQSGTYAGAASTSWSTTRQDFDNQIGNVLSSTANEFHITGLQLEIGDSATDFEHRTFAEELLLCQRYFYKVQGVNSDRPGIGGYVVGTNEARMDVVFPCAMRAAPTIGGTGTAQFDAHTDSADFNCSAIIIDEVGTDIVTSLGIQIATSGMVNGQSGGMRFRSSGSSLSFSAELP